MNASQMANLIEADERLAGLDINVNVYRNTVEAYGFNMTADWKVTKQILTEKGFSCGPNFGQWEGETEPRPSLRERY